MKQYTFEEDKFGVRFFIYGRKKYFVINDLNGSENKNSLLSIQRYANKDPNLRIFGRSKKSVKVPNFCLSFNRYKVLNKSEIKKAIESVEDVELSNISVEWLMYHKINVQIKEKDTSLKLLGTVDVLYRRAMKYKIKSASNKITENREIV